MHDCVSSQQFCQIKRDHCTDDGSDDRDKKGHHKSEKISSRNLNYLPRQYTDDNLSDLTDEIDDKADSLIIRNPRVELIDRFKIFDDLRIAEIKRRRNSDDDPQQ